jgi:hypothetical protein
MGDARAFVKESFGLNDRSSRIAAVVAASALVLNWAAVITFLVPRAGRLKFLKLHYTAALGVDWVGEWWKLFVFPVLGCAIFFVNGAFSGILARKHRLLGLSILFSTAVIEILLAGGGVTAILLNS